MIEETYMPTARFIGLSISILVRPLRVEVGICFSIRARTYIAPSIIAL